MLRPQDSPVTLSLSTEEHENGRLPWQRNEKNDLSHHTIKTYVAPFSINNDQKRNDIHSLLSNFYQVSPENYLSPLQNCQRYAEEETKKERNETNFKKREREM